ncbi:hypothetical protein C0989_010271 [Termitomyces sp. Mn162]|nr:hypothetical protein C0989_010271 [Termitomyces sp. Mn162]
MAYLSFSPSWPWSDWPQLYAPASPSPSSDSDPDVKQEPADPACFIIEQANDPQPLAPPTEVPLRATQASSDMRRMMNVFRLNPFAIHGAVPAPFESAHALDAEPITFEFQLDLAPGILDPDPGPSLDSPSLRPFSPDFDLHPKVPDDPWPVYHDQPWDISYPDADDFDVYRPEPQHLQKAPLSTYPQPDWAHQSRDVAYHTAPASRSPYTDVSLPSPPPRVRSHIRQPTINSLRRWSLPDAHPSSHFLI